MNSINIDNNIIESGEELFSFLDEYKEMEKQLEAQSQQLQSQPLSVPQLQAQESPSQPQALDQSQPQGQQSQTLAQAQTAASGSNTGDGAGTPSALSVASDLTQPQQSQTQPHVPDTRMSNASAKSVARAKSVSEFDKLVLELRRDHPTYATRSP